MNEREIYRIQLKSVRTAPPGYQIPTCQGALCRVTTERLLVPGATYGSETPISEIEFAETEEPRRIGSDPNIQFIVGVHTSKYYMALCCNSQEDCEQLSKAIRTAWELSQDDSILAADDFPQREEMSAEKDLRIPDELPVLPVKKTIIYPSTIKNLELEQESALHLLDDVIDDNKLLVVVAQKFVDKEPMKLDDLFRVGTVARLAQMGLKPDGKMQIILLGLERVVLGELMQEHPYFVAHVALKTDIQEELEETEVTIHEVIPSFKTLIARSQKMLESVIVPRLDTKEPREIVYTMAYFTGMGLEQGQRLIELDSVSARAHSLRDYLTLELEKFELCRQAAEVSSRGQSKSLEVALNAFNTADTWEDSLRILKMKKRDLLSEEALNTLRSHIATLRQRQASGHWIFRLEHDLEFLEDALAHGISVARQHLEGRIQMLQNQQDVYEAFKILATVNTPEDILVILAQQQRQPFSPVTFNVLQMLFEQVAAQDPEGGERLQLLLSLLEEARVQGVDSAIESFMKRVKPDYKEDFDNINEILEQYLTSTTYEEAFQTLKEHQEVLLSDLVHDMIEQDVAQMYRMGRNDMAEDMEMHLHLLEDARLRGIDQAWQAFTEDLE